MEQNIEEKIKEIEKISKSWKNRNLSIFGKNIVAKNLMLSKVNNVIMVVPNMKKKSLTNAKRPFMHFYGMIKKIK